MTQFKGSNADDLAQTSLINAKPPTVLKVPNVGLLPSVTTANNGEIVYDTSVDKPFIVVNGVFLEISTV